MKQDTALGKIKVTKIKKLMLAMSLVFLGLVAANTSFAVSELDSVHPSHPSHPVWSYDGSKGLGVNQWKKVYPKCAAGTQSPIDIPNNIKPDSSLPSLEFVFTPTPVKVIDTGHAIQANLLNQSDTLTVGSKKYVLQEFHLHVPSENKIKTQGYPAEIHLVYKDKQGKYAVVGIFVKQGAANGTLGGIINDVQKAKQSKSLAKKVKPASLPIINANDLLPSDSNSYYAFMGSLTTPPCTQHIQWYLLPDPITASASEMNALKKLYRGNVRPDQVLNGRTIVYKPPATNNDKKS